MCKIPLCVPTFNPLFPRDLFITFVITSFNSFFFLPFLSIFIYPLPPLLRLTMNLTNNLEYDE